MVKCLCVLLLMASLLMVSPDTSRAASVGMSCSDAVNALIPCGAYLIGAGGNDPSAECCKSAQSLNKMAETVTSRRALCECLKSTGPSFGVVPAKAKHLPPFCKLRLDIPISPYVNCTRVQ